MKRILFAVLGAVVLLALTVVAVGVVKAKTRLTRSYPLEVAPLTASLAEASLQRGEHLSRIYGCRECHAEDLGGQVFDDGPLGTLSAPNLTLGDGTATWRYEEADWVRAIFSGVSPDGRALLIMPSHHYRPALSDDDAAALIAYLAQVPKVDRTVPPTSLSLPGLLMFGLGDLPLLPAEAIDFSQPRRGPAAVEPGPTREYGLYMVSACTGCHGADYRGGPAMGPPGTPAPSDISPTQMRQWKKDEFVRVLREGKKRDGSEVGKEMPWVALQHLSDDEITAVWLALGGRPDES